MRPTRIPILFALAVVAGASAYLLTSAYYANVPALPSSWPLVLLLLALLVGYTAYTTRARLAGKPHTRPIHPLTVARLAAFAKATSPVAAVVTGAYAGFLVDVGRINGPQASSDTRTAAIGVGCGLALVVAALLLEWGCRVKTPPGRP